MALFDYSYGIALHGAITEVTAQEELLPEILTQLRVHGARDLAQSPDGLCFKGGCFSDWCYAAMTKAGHIAVEKKRDRIVLACRFDLQPVFIYLTALALGMFVFALIPLFFVGILALPFPLVVLGLWAAVIPLGIVWVNWRIEKFLRRVIVNWSRRTMGIDGAVL